jgi:predicted RNA binding protein YcfA (HicA-like mRNA interferase family)
MPRIAPIHYRRVVRVLAHEGFALARERGDHMVFTKPGIERPVVVPRYDPLPVLIIKNILERPAFPANVTWNFWNKFESPNSGFSFSRSDA